MDPIEQIPPASSPSYLFVHHVVLHRCSRNSAWICRPGQSHRPCQLRRRSSPVIISKVNSLLSKLWRRTCGTSITDEQLAAAEADFQANLVPPPHSLAPTAATINIYFHVISKDATLAGGNIPFVPFISSKGPSCLMRSQGYTDHIPDRRNEQGLWRHRVLLQACEHHPNY
jgi:hypothetical protein